MSYKLTQSVYNLTTLAVTEKSILTYLAFCARTDGLVYANTQQISQATGYSPSTIQKQLRWLEYTGYLSREGNNHITLKVNEEGEIDAGK